ncbi:uncharacterized protein TEOVI_000468200 [Trypanosoma equiperdum]|uniref:Uncharacterized protein n=1 Tax=Trypanosoma equiperdum TaxID=5694 RepID=A0A1G4I5Q5_TRYEQ|nr:hypothetical protein, conserved [Trypanosoma equiperdum]
MWNAFSGFQPPKLRDGNGGWGSGRPYRPMRVGGQPYHKERFGAPSYPQTQGGYQHHGNLDPMNRSYSRHTPQAAHRIRQPNIDEPFAWKAFMRRSTEGAIYRGTTQLEGSQRTKESGETTSPNGLARHVDGEAWNAYWGEYSDHFASRIDDVQEHLSKGERYNGKRCVRVATPIPKDSLMESFKSRMIDYARHFGAIECVTRDGGVVGVQFTTHRSAELFAVWAASMTFVEILGDTVKPDEVNGPVEMVVRLAPHDPNRLTTTLRLGDNIVLSTAFVEGLFKGIFDAEDIKFHAGAFQITFGSVQAAKVALHSVQRHLFDGFGLLLTFSEVPLGAGPLMPHAK